MVEAQPIDEIYLLEPEEDDEPLTMDELAQMARSRADFAAGRFCTLEEFNKRIGVFA